MGEACFDDVCIVGVIVDMEWATGMGWRRGSEGEDRERWDDSASRLACT